MTKYNYLKDENGDILLDPQSGLPYSKEEFFISKKGNLLRKKGWKNGLEYTFKYDDNDFLIEQNPVPDPTKSSKPYSGNIVSRAVEPIQPVVGNGPPPAFELGTPDPRSYSKGKAGIAKGLNDVESKFKEG